MISFVIPVYNEEESLDAFFSVLKSESQKLDEKFEIIFIDDGSTDKSLKILKDLEKLNQEVVLFSFRKNQGKADALTFGFQKSKGTRIITLDADLQDRPEEIKSVLAKMDEGFDVVSGWRKNRQDSTKKIVSSKVFNAIVSVFWGLNLHDYNCGLKGYTSDAAKSLRLYGGFHRFIPLIAYQEGFSVGETPVEHAKRKFGKSKYGFSKLWKDIPDIFTMLFLARYSSRPLHFFGTFGLAMIGISTLILIYLAYLRLMGETIGNRPLLLFGILLMLSGMQIFFTGFLAELIINLNRKEKIQIPLKYQSS